MARDKDTRTGVAKRGALRQIWRIAWLEVADLMFWAI